MEDKILKAIEGLNKKFDNLENRFGNLENKFDGLENRFGNLENKFDGLENRFGNLENKFDGFENRFDNLENQVIENTQILKALMHSAEVNKADHDKMTVDIAHIKGDVTALRKDLSAVETITAYNYSDIVKLKAIK